MATITLKSISQKPIANLILSALEAERRELLTAIKKTEFKLKNLEEKYHISTDEFLAQPSRIPELDALEWLGEEETLKLLQDKLSQLEEIQICT